MRWCPAVSSALDAVRTARIRYARGGAGPVPDSAAGKARWRKLARGGAGVRLEPSLVPSPTPAPPPPDPPPPPPPPPPPGGLLWLSGLLEDFQMAAPGMKEPLSGNRSSAVWVQGGTPVPGSASVRDQGPWPTGTDSPCFPDRRRRWWTGI